MLMIRVKRPTWSHDRRLLSRKREVQHFYGLDSNKDARRSAAYSHGKIFVHDSIIPRRDVSNKKTADTQSDVPKKVLEQSTGSGAVSVICPSFFARRKDDDARTTENHRCGGPLPVVRARPLRPL
jgi:hypothetical protein